MRYIIGSNQVALAKNGEGEFYPNNAKLVAGETAYVVLSSYTVYGTDETHHPENFILGIFRDKELALEAAEKLSAYIEGDDTAKPFNEMGVVEEEYVSSCRNNVFLQDNTVTVTRTTVVEEYDSVIFRRELKNVYY